MLMVSLTEEIIPHYTKKVIVTETVKHLESFDNCNQKTIATVRELQS